MSSGIGPLSKKNGDADLYQILDTLHYNGRLAGLHPALMGMVPG